MNGSQKQSTKKGKSLSRGEQFCLFFVVCAVILSVGALLRGYFSSPQFAEVDVSVDIGEYERLLSRAKELTKQYAALAGPQALLGGGEDIRQLPTSVLPRPSVLQSGVLHQVAGNDRSQSIMVPSNSAKADLILGMAQDTDAKNLVVFCRSLRIVSNADAIIFINKPIPPRHEEIAKENRITLIGFDLEDVNPASMRKYHPSTLRWYLFHNYFKADPAATTAKYGRVWMIDVRDSYFQSDPFAFVPLSPAPSFHVFSGVESFPIKDCGWNSGWVKDCFGAPVLQDIGSKGIICSGVSVGTTAAVLEYLRIMSDIVSGQDAAQGSRFPACERNGVDQGAHNVLVHTGALDHLNLRKWGQADGPVANMQSRLATVQCAGDKCTVKNKAGVAVAVVHQYDRYPDLQKYLFAKYVDWVKTGDLQAEWDYEPACRAYAYKADSDMFKGVCDVKAKGGVTAAASCCALCDQQPGCQAFTFFAGSCFFKSCGAGHGAPKSLPGAVSGYLKS